MSAAGNRRPQPGATTGEAVLLASLAGLVVAALVVINVAVRVAAEFEPPAAALPGDPFVLVFAVLGGDLPWPAAATWITAALLTVLVVPAIALTASASRRRRTRTRVDGASPHMGRGRDITSLTTAHATAEATRLGVVGAVGLPIGETLGGAQLTSTWEDLFVTIAGPRTGKTTSLVIPAILAAPGAVLATSNKRDVLDAVRGPRAATGPVWVFDPQTVAGEEPVWWWNPLTYVTDEVRAARLAEHFAASSPGERKDAHFEAGGESLLAGCLLAAALDHRPITQVWTWLTRPGDEEPADVLRAGGFPLTADQVSGIATTPEKERGSLYSTARRMAAPLTVRATTRWITDDGSGRPHFDPHDFIRTGGTLFCLSREGQGSAGALVMALTAAVVEAAEELATASAGGRLAVPLVGVLDEAANVCRWRQLPDLFSHFGSRGIILQVVLQSWSQGCEVWGEAGMKKLWSAANIKIFGGGVAEDAFLESLSKLIGDFDHPTSTLSSGRGGRNVSRALHRERILDVADLAALPRGRAVVLASGSRPTLIRTRPWMDGPHADAVRTSIAAHDPHAAAATDALDAAGAPRGAP